MIAEISATTEQHVNIETHGKNTLDLVNATIQDAYKTILLPLLSCSTQRAKLVLTLARTLSEGVTSALQDCFEYRL